MSLSRILLVLSVFLLVCCKQEIKTVFPDITEETEQYLLHNNYTVIVYINVVAGQCVVCALESLKAWQKYGRVLEKYKTGVLPVIRYNDKDAVLNACQSMGEFYPVIDSLYKFRMLNNGIFESAVDNIFVVDRNKNVIFTESPIKNEKIWKKFIKRIKK
jgi:hypothetical protein